MWPLTPKTAAKGRQKTPAKKVPAKKVALKKSSAKKAAPKRGAKQAQSLIWRRRWDMFIRVTSVTVACLAVVISIYIWKSGLLEEWVLETGDSVDRQIAKAGFSVDEVRIIGQEHSTLDQVRTALGLYDGQSIMSLDLERMLARVEGLPWVKQATIVRMMPDALEVTITEHKAAALWQLDGQLFLIDGEGAIITDQEVGAFADLPYIVGEGANAHLADLVAMQDKYPALFARIKSAVWVGDRRWDLNFRNGVKIKLPETGSDLAWEELYQYEDRQKILSKEVLVIDLRLHGKMVVRLTPKEMERRKRIVESGQKEENI